MNKKIILATTLFIFSSSLLLSFLKIEQQFGWDEAVYAVKARELYIGMSDTGFGIHRPLGMPVVGWGILHFGSSENMFRMVSIVVSIFFLMVLFFMYDRLFKVLSVAFLFSLLFLSSTLFIDNAAKFLSDLPSSLLVIFGVYYLWLHFYDKNKSEKFIFIAAAFFAAAFYFRYGIISTIIVIGVCTFIFNRKVIITDVKKYILCGIFLLILLIPHFIYSYINTESILGIMLEASKLSHRDYIGEGLASYVLWIPSLIAGKLVGGIIILGLILFIYGLVSKNKNTALINYLVSIAFGSILITGLFTHAEERYIIFSVTLLLMVSVHLIYQSVMRIRFPVVGVKIAYVVSLIIILINLVHGISYYGERLIFLAEKEEIIRESGQFISDIAKAEECIVFSKTIPQTTWYSECATFYSEDFFVNSTSNDKQDLFAIVYSKQRGEGIEKYEKVFSEKYEKKIIIKDDRGIYGNASIYFQR